MFDCYNLSMNIKLTKPKYKDLYLRTKLLQDKNTMSFNHDYGGTVAFNESDYKVWYEKWINGDDRYYYYVYMNNTFVGEATYYLSNGKYMISIIIDSNYRNIGIGNAVLNLLIDDAKQKGINELYDEIAIDNPAINLFLKNSFMIVKENKESIVIKKIVE